MVVSIRRNGTDFQGKSSLTVPGLIDATPHAFRHKVPHPDIKTLISKLRLLQIFSGGKES